MSGITGTQAELLYTLPASVTKNTYTSQAVISAVGTTAPVAKIAGGLLASVPNPVGRAFYLKAMGTIATTSAATFALALGLDTIAGTPANAVTCFTTVAPTASVTAQWDLEAWYTVQAAGETGGTTIQINGKYQASTVATGSALQSASPWTAMFAGSVTGLLENTTYYVELLGTWSASAAGNTTTVQQMFWWGLN